MVAAQLKTKIRKEITDIWTDDFCRISYMSLTVHFMKKVGQKIIYCSRVIALTALDTTKRKTYDILLDVLNKKLDEFSLTAFKDKITFVTDKGSNIVKCLKNNYAFYILYSAFY